MKEINGCEKDSTYGEKWLIGGYKLTRCPLKVITTEGMEYMEAYKFYKNGILPLAGGWMSQTQSFIEAMAVIDTEVVKVEKEIQKRKV